MKLNKTKVTVINLEHRTDRKENVLRALKSIEDLDGCHFEFFKALHDESNGALGCARSHFSVVADFMIQTHYDHLIVLEDDISFRQKFRVGDLYSFLARNGIKFDVFLLSHNAAITAENFPLGFCRVFNSLTASGYIVNREFAPKLLACFAESINGLSRYYNHRNKKLVRSIFAIDILWKQLQLKYKFITIKPSLGFQVASYSDIEKINVDYGV